MQLLWNADYFKITGVYTNRLELCFAAFYIWYSYWNICDRLQSIFVGGNSF